MSNNTQRRYYPQPVTSPSQLNLIPPTQRISGGSDSSSISGHSSPTTAPHANFARGPPSIRSTASNASFNDSPYSLGPGRKAPSRVPSISDKYSLSPDPATWGADLSPQHPEPDDFLHNPDPRRDRKNDSGGNIFTYRGLVNLGCILILTLGIITLFAGYPIISYLKRHPLSTLGGFNLGGINATGQIPSMQGNWGLIDVDTPKKFYTIKSYHDPSQDMELVFSDEFEKAGRSFYPGDDPYWEAVDLHYWQTNNLEWYDPAAVTTKDGALKVTLSKKKNHDLNYEGGMISTWNKFCFTGGMLLSSVTLPGIGNVAGLWPAVWAMGNLGRAGYGASLDGMWPYTYDSCDVGTAPNQTIGNLPAAALVNGDKDVADGALSFLPGQRLSRCTCPGESHPGPVHANGDYVGRAAPEIDVFEAQVRAVGEVSQSAQWAPFNAAYAWKNTTENQILGPHTKRNTYMGGAFQQATSGVTATDPNCYELTGGCFSTYGFEYVPGYDTAYITWISDNQVTWTLNAGGLSADSLVEIGDRPIPLEPLYLLINLGISQNFGSVDFEHLTFPTVMSIDWIRVYQHKDKINIGCDPPDFPTQAYINQYMEAYTNPNYTTWEDDFKQPMPKNRLVTGCN